MVKVKFIHSPTGYGMAYNAGDECETTPEKAEQLVAAGVAEILPDDDGEGDPPPPPEGGETGGEGDPPPPPEGGETGGEGDPPPPPDKIEDRRVKDKAEKR